MKFARCLKFLMAASGLAAPLFALHLSAQETRQTLTTWKPAAGSDGLWSTAANWSGGTVPVAGSKATVNNAPAACIINSAAGGGQISIGESGDGLLIVTNGGNLLAGDTNVLNPRDMHEFHDHGWTAIGQNQTGEMIICSGASVTFRYHLWIGFKTGARGTLIMNGGTASVAYRFGLGAAGGTGIARINGGTLKLKHLGADDIQGTGSVLDITGGTVVVSGDDTATVTSLMSSNKITAYGGAGKVNVHYDGSNTIITADYMNTHTNTTWKPAAGSNGLWSTAANWSGGIVPVTGYKALINNASAACIINSKADGAQISIGEGGDGLLIVTNGGIVSAGATVANTHSTLEYHDHGWTSIGHIQNGEMIISSGASVTFNYHLWIGQHSGARGILIMNGGTASVVAAHARLGLGMNGGTGIVHMNGGTLTLARLGTADIQGAESVLDITGGTVVVSGDDTATVTSLMSSNKITAYGGAGKVNVHYDGSNTIITADHMNAHTNTTWNPAGNPGSDGLWSTAANWSGRIVPGPGYRALINNAPAACIINSTVGGGQVSIGEGGDGLLIVTNGGNLLAGDTNVLSRHEFHDYGWTGIGRGHTGEMIITKGASATFHYHLEIGINTGGRGTLIMHGGTASVAGRFALGGQGGRGIAYIDGGTLTLAQLGTGDVQGAGSLLDIAGGTVVVSGDDVAAVNALVSSNRITAYRGDGKVNVSYDGSTTTITGIPPVSKLPPHVDAIWNPAAGSDGLWTTAANWSGGTVPVAGSKAFFNNGQAPCIVNSTVGGGQVSVGEDGNGVLIVTNGGNLLAGDTNGISLHNQHEYHVRGWTAIDQNQTGEIIITSGGSAIFRYHLWIGAKAGAHGTLIMNGGTASVTGADARFGLGVGGGTGIAQINGGTLTLGKLGARDIQGTGSVLDISGGTVVVLGNDTAAVNGLVSSNKITAYGGTGKVNVGYNGSTTTIIGTPGRL